MSRHKSVEPAADRPNEVTSGRTARVILPVPVRLAFGAVAIALLLFAARLPIWRATFHAPQYPQGLRVTAYGNRVAGDMGEIKELSHYIGMASFNFTGMPEMKLWPFVIAFAMAAAVVALAMRRRWLRRLGCAAIWLIPVGALADVQFRLWQTGHSLDPTAAIRVSPFTPRVLGPTTLMNFTITGLPGTALLLVAVAAAVVTSAPFLARRLTRGSAPVTESRQGEARRSQAKHAQTQHTNTQEIDTEAKVP